MARPFDQSVIRLDHLEYVDAVCRERHLAGVCFSVLNFDVHVACGPRSKKGGVAEIARAPARGAGLGKKLRSGAC